MIRCNWCLSNDLYIKYHNEEWGVPVHYDKIHFEYLVLESNQSGLSWITILKKRGFKFLESITVYLYIQAIGVINDHIYSCFREI